MSCLESYFGDLPDPRASNVSHRLSDLIVMMVAASLCGAACATEFALFAEVRKDVLNRLIDYDTAPSHDTFSRVLRVLEQDAFSHSFAAFAAGFARALERAGGPTGSGQAASDVIAVDGKALRRAYEVGHAAAPPLMVSAFAVQARLCLAGVMPGPDENEIEAALKVVDLLDLTDKTVTADALHCHHRMAEAVCARGGDYVLALKGNRRAWLNAAQAQFAGTVPASAETTCEGHGRVDWRRAEVVAAKAPLMQGHAAFARLTTRRGNAKPVTRFFMMSTVLLPEQVLDTTRNHWQVENGLHWILDVHLDEDFNRARKDNAPANIALLKRIARNILQTIDSPKVPISHRIKKCAWQNTYLIKALTHMR